MSRDAAGMDPLTDDGLGDALFAFVPFADAAACADCHGFFVAKVGHCPGAARSST